MFAALFFSWCLIGTAVALRNLFEVRKLDISRFWSLVGAMLTVFVWPISLSLRWHLDECDECCRKLTNLIARIERRSTK